MSTIISNNVKTAKEIYWNVVNYMTAEYRDILVDLKRREDNDIYDGYEGYVKLLIERKTIIEEVRTKLGISNGLVYGLNHELIEIDVICFLMIAKKKLLVLLFVLFLILIYQPPPD